MQLCEDGAGEISLTLKQFVMILLKNMKQKTKYNCKIS
jgi:hypothetical protein